MEIRNFLNENINVIKDKEKVKKIEDLYNMKLNGEILYLVSNLGEEKFFDEEEFIKLLSFQEIMDASDDMNVDFISISVLPVFDVGDNDYISFSFNDNCWCKFNIVDELVFSKKKNISDFFM